MGELVDLSERFTVLRWERMWAWFQSGEPSVATMLAVMDAEPDFGEWARARLLESRKQPAQDDGA